MYATYLAFLFTLFCSYRTTISYPSKARITSGIIVDCLYILYDQYINLPWDLFRVTYSISVIQIEFKVDVQPAHESGLL